MKLSIIEYFGSKGTRGASAQNAFSCQVQSEIQFKIEVVVSSEVTAGVRSVRFMMSHWSTRFNCCRLNNNPVAFR
jgi:hypothetical protein